MNIFWKDCPHCGSSQPVTTLHCGCGYCFDPEQLEGTIEALELQAQEEQLYYEYLNARLAQMQSANRGPANPTDAYEDAPAAGSGDILRAAEAELARQSQRVAEARERVERARASGASSIRDHSTPPFAQSGSVGERGPGYRALPARNTAHAAALRPRSESPKCPRCTAALPPGSTRCGLCGSQLSGPDFIPAGLLDQDRTGRRPRRRTTG